jgi:hypothetical protein
MIGLKKETLMAHKDRAARAPSPDADEMREVCELIRLLDNLEDIMPVDVEHGTIGLNVRTAEDVERVAAAMVRAKALHNKLVARGKIAGRMIW